MTPRRVLLTGAEGFVGQHLRPALQAAFPDAAITGTGLGGTAAKMDVTDRDAVFAAFAQAQPDVCVHLAGISAIGAAGADPGRAWAVNLHGTLNIADAIMAESPVCTLLFISTSEVYGGSFARGAALDETAPPDPMNLYAATKAAAEMGLSALARRGLRVVRLRPFNHTGPGQSEAFVAASFAAQIARIEAGLAPPVIKVGALTPERDFLDVRDVCAAYIATIRRIDHIPNNAILNIASGQSVAIGWILQTLLQQARCEISVEEDQARLRPVEISRAAGNAAAAAALLGWKPEIPLENTLRDLLEAARRAV